VSTEFRPPLDVSSGTFSTEDVGFFVSDGTVNYTPSGLTVGTIDLHGRGGLDVPRPGSLTTSDGVQVLTLPFETHFAVSSEAPEDWNLSFVGQLVATRVVPEPGAGLLIGLACTAALGRRTRRPR
jgi:hypothetical protein